MRVYRIAKAIHSPTGAAMMSGEGGLRGSARWHTKGRLIIYTATSQALATLEIAVNLKNPSVIPAYRILEVEIPDDLIIKIEATMLPAGWDHKDGEPFLARSIGNRWLSSQPSPGLQIPSSVIPQEYNVLLNPAHSDFTQITYGDPLDFPFDSRIKA
jgi:RES domain-containing protein